MPSSAIVRAPPIAVVLPPRESFSPAAAGAIALMVERLHARTGAFAPVVLGMPPPDPPFAGIAFEPVRPAFRPMAFGARYATGVLRALRGLDPALIEVHNRPDLARFLAGKFAERPVVLFLHNDPQGMPACRTPAARADLLARLGGVAVVSAFLRQRFLEGITSRAASPVAVIPNALDLTRLPPPAPFEARAREILFAGRVVADKGADQFVAACARALPQLPGWQARMIGADRFGSDSPETPFLARLRPLAAAGGVRMEGYQPHTAVLATMARAAIVVVPSRWAEPFGLSALEAMASGAALITTRRGALADIAADAALYADPEDSAALAAAIVSLATDEPRREALARAGKRRAQDFALPSIAVQLDGFRAECLRGATENYGVSR